MSKFKEINKNNCWSRLFLHTKRQVFLNYLCQLVFSDGLKVKDMELSCIYISTSTLITIICRHLWQDKEK